MSDPFYEERMMKADETKKRGIIIIVVSIAVVGDRFSLNAGRYLTWLS